MHPHRRRKKRPNYDMRTVEVSRGQNGFGFTISGQQPCILSCIVNDSPAESAGLRAGDFLISVNGLNVSKLPHDAVVQLIGNSTGIIKMTIAENYFSDSSDDDILNGRSGNRQRPKYPHANKSRMHRAGRITNYSPNAIKTANTVVIDQDISSREYKPSGVACKELNCNVSKSGGNASSSAHCVIINSSISNTNDINNVSAMVNPGLEQVRAIKVIRDLRTGAMFEEVTTPTAEIEKAAQVEDNLSKENSLERSEAVHQLPSAASNRMEPLAKIIEKESAIECQAVVGYLGTIEMPKQIATSSKLQTVRSCIRKMRQEKRTPCTVLMTILPSCMTLRNGSGELLAEYPAKRLNYVSCSSENDYRFFGLVTSASYPIDMNDFDGGKKEENAQKECSIAISNSCHVFMVDTQVTDHQSHAKKAEIFKINCTIDPVSGMCLEFPNNSEYIVNIIRIMYSLKPPNGFSAKGNIENISRLSNLDRKSCSPRGSNFVRKINRPKVFHDIKLNARPDVPIEQNLPNNMLHQNNMPNDNGNNVRQDPEGGLMNGNDFVANSPQPSNHSEITTASSNSDSGIGFHNDCQNISDRILVVDFPNPVRNNFNVNAPYIGPAFNSREGKVLSLRENNSRPAGVVGLDIEMDAQFLSNTTPVVEGFGGQGRPLNHLDALHLGNLRNQVSNQNLFHPKRSEGESSKSMHDSKVPSTSQYNMYPEGQKHAVKNKLTVRAMPDRFPSDKTRKTDDCKSPNRRTLHSHSQSLNGDQFIQRSRNRDSSFSNGSPQYDPVYNESSCYEEHHYEIIYPDENTEQSNGKNLLESKQTDVAHYSERAVDVPDNDYYDVDNLNSSVTACSYDEMSVTSSRSHDCTTKKDNYSIDDISIYSSKSHDEVANSSKNRLKNKTKKLQTSVDDILIFGTKTSANNDASPKKCDKDTFLHPGNVIKLRSKKSKKPSMFSKTKQISCESQSKDGRKKCNKDSMLRYKLSPKVFGLSRPSASVEDVFKSSSERSGRRDSSGVTWGHLEGTASEPDLRECHNNDFFTGSGGGGWGRWSSGGSGRQRPLRRPPLQHHNTDTHMYTESLVCPAPPSPAPSGGPSSWAASLELLLADPAGVHALSAFLEREFSAENIRFWTACERYAYAPASERPALAFTVHNTHLAEGAPEPVNVDAHARQHARDHLHEAPHDLFLQAQKQIFNLMKFDSYPRFIKSEVHRECLLAERRGGAPPYPGDPALACQPSPTKLKKSVSNAEDRRRKSLIPWHRKQRSKSRDRCEGAQEEEEEEEGRGETHSTHGGSNSSLLSTWDLAKGIGHKCGSTCSCCEGAAKCPSRAALCRVLLPGAAATSSVVAVGSHTVQQLLERLLLKHAVHFRAYEVYLPNSNKPIDIQQSSSVLAGLEVTVEQRVVFKLDLPNRKVISVKSKPNKALGDVLRPILHKYGVTGGSATCVTLKNTPLQLTQPVQVVDGQRLQVSLLSGPESEPQSAVPQTAAKTSHSAADAANGAPSLDEITNRVFEELLQGKADRHKPNGEEDSIKSDNCSSEHSSGIFGRFLRRDDHRSKGLKIKRVAAAAAGQTRPSTNSSPASAPGSVASDGTESKGPLIAKLRAGVRVQNAVGAPTALENTEFLENLKQIQKVRLKDKTINNNFIHPPLLNGQETQPGKENSKTIPVAAIRLTPPVLSITKPSPAPRLSLGQGSPTKLNPKAVEATQEANNKTEEIIPTKVQAYNSLEKKNLDNNNIENKYHSNLTQDYLNGSTTSGSDHFMRSCDILNSSFNSTSSSCENDKQICDPPPLPPKPKVLPIKPSNWGHSLTDEAIINLRMQEVSLPEIGSKDGLERTKRTVYLDQPSSSFV